MDGYKLCILDEKGRLISYTGAIFKNKKFKKKVSSSVIKRLLNGEVINIKIEGVNLTGGTFHKDSKIKYIHFTERYFYNQRQNEMENLRHDLKNKIAPISGLMQIGNTKMISPLLNDMVEFIDENVI